MEIKEIALAAVLGLCATSASASSVTYEYVMEYRQEWFGGVQVYEEVTEFVEAAGEVVTHDVMRYDSGEEGPLAGEDDVWGFAGPFSQTSPGALFTLTMTVDLGDYMGGGMYGVEQCLFSGADCRGYDYWMPLAPGDRLSYGTWAGFDDNLNGFGSGDISFTGPLISGGRINIFMDHVDGPRFSGAPEFWGYYSYYSADFAFVSATLPDCSAFAGITSFDSEAPVCRSAAPVDLVSAPLPASAAFLGGGFLSFAAIGRRRRSRRPARAVR